MDFIEHTHNLKLPLLVPNQSGKEFTHNEALIIIDNLMHNTVNDILSTPPEELIIGSKYIVATEADGSFKNKENQIAIYDENGWRFIESQEGYFVWVINRNSLYIFNNGLWGILDTSDKRLEITEPKINEILKYDGSNFINSNSLVDIDELSIINNLVVKDTTTKLNRLKLETTENNSNINVSSNGEDWLNCISINNNSGKVNFETDITINGAPIATGGGSVELKENYEITEAISIIEFTNLDPSLTHKFTLDNLQCSNSSGTILHSTIGYGDNSYVASNYCWENNVTNSNEGYDYIKYKNKGSSYQLTNDKYGDAGIKSTAGSNVELYLYPTNNANEKYMTCTVLATAAYSSLKLYKSFSSCLVYYSNQIDRLKFYLASGNFSKGIVKHYTIK